MKIKIEVGADVSLDDLIDANFEPTKNTLIYQNYIHRIVLVKHDDKYTIKKVIEIPRDFTTFEREVEYDEKLLSRKNKYDSGDDVFNCFSASRIP